MRLLASLQSRPAPRSCPLIGVGYEFAKPEVVAREMQFADIGALGFRGQDFVAVLLRRLTTLTSERELGIREHDLNIRTPIPLAVAILDRVLGCDARFDVRLMHDHAQPRDIARGKNVAAAFDPHVEAHFQFAALVRRNSDSREIQTFQSRMPSGGDEHSLCDQTFFARFAFRHDAKLSRALAFQRDKFVPGANPNTFALVNLLQPFAKFLRIF